MIKCTDKRKWLSWKKITDNKGNRSVDVVVEEYTSPPMGNLTHSPAITVCLCLMSVLPF